MGFNSGLKGLKYSVLLFVEKIYKMQHLEGSGTPFLYVGRTVLKGQRKESFGNPQAHYLQCHFRPDTGRHIVTHQLYKTL
jgi:hypothetical protein